MITRRTYFERLYRTAFEDCPKSYRKTCKRLFETPFRYSVFLDKNRYSDGLSYRYRLGFESTEPCSVFEMMVALAVRMEEDIMTDPAYGSRISQWFVRMFQSMGLNEYDDDHYDEEAVDDITDRMLDRKYGKSRKGGLFTFRHKTNRDVRDIEIWDQMQLWLGMYY